MSGRRIREARAKFRAAAWRRYEQLLQPWTEQLHYRAKRRHCVRVRRPTRPRPLPNVTNWTTGYRSRVRYWEAERPDGGRYRLENR